AHLPLSKDMTLKQTELRRHQQTRNLWDDVLPPELRHMILSFSDPLTQYLNSFGTYDHQNLNALANIEYSNFDPLCTNIWRIALKIEWQGPLASLPGWFRPIPKREWYELVKCKQFCKRLLEAKAQKTLDADDFDPVNLAMRYCWFDLVDSYFKLEDQSLAQCAAENGHLDYYLLLQEQSGVHSTNLIHTLADSVAVQGLYKDLIFIEYLYPDAISVDTTTFAIYSNNLELIKYLYRKYGFTELGMTEAVCFGNLSVIQFLHDQDDEWFDFTVMDQAANDGHLDIVEFLHNNRDEGCSTKALDNAACNGHLDIVEFLHNNRDEGCTTAAMDDAAKRGHLKIVKFLHKHRQEGCTTAAMDNAAANGHLTVVEFLHNNRNEGCTTSAMDDAAANGHLEVVKFLHEHRREGCTSAAVKRAASAGHLEVVKFLSAHRKK
ncbi:hypothetical protein HDV05_005631, partial [Chytridiales sp. JEL 0842]